MNFPTAGRFVGSLTRPPIGLLPVPAMEYRPAPVIPETCD